MAPGVLRSMPRGTNGAHLIVFFTFRPDVFAKSQLRDFMQSKTKHALAFPGGPAICGAGQGRKLHQRVIGTPIDDLATLDIDTHVSCKHCRIRVRRRFPAWVVLGRGIVPR